MSEQPHANHGHSPARWTGTVISAAGFLIGGLAFPFHIWPVVYAGGALQIVALIVVGAMNAAGYGVPDVWGELKAEAKAGKPPVDVLAPRRFGHARGRRSRALPRSAARVFDWGSARRFANEPRSRRALRLGARAPRRAG